MRKILCIGLILMLLPTVALSYTYHPSSVDPKIFKSWITVRKGPIDDLNITFIVKKNPDKDASIRAVLMRWEWQGGDVELNGRLLGYAYYEGNTLKAYLYDEISDYYYKFEYSYQDKLDIDYWLGPFLR